MKGSDRSYKTSLYYQKRKIAIISDKKRNEITATLSLFL